MEAEKLKIKDVILVRPTVYADTRGFFMETYHRTKFKELGIDGVFSQDNFVFSKKGVLRGLHYQHTAPQGKLLRCVKGEILDVAVDIRPDSPTFGEHVSVVLSESNMNQLWIPKGFAHGYAVLSKEAYVLYKCDQVWVPEYDSGIRWDDPDLNIDWRIENPLISEKDSKLPLLREKDEGH
jgi:dTDP-4-dehydrorhamnose 3,5-epimerase